MLGAAVPLGLQLVEAEKELERAFRSRAIDQAALGRLTEAAAVITGQLRGAHLGAHIKATALLTPRQIHRYQALRGYAAGHADHAGGHKH
jgi:Spy/CpxP family protein refolding chaperone